MNTEELLKKVQEISEETKKEKQESAADFNVFRLCGVDHYEVWHSKIISEFLSPNGAHGCRHKFLEAFFKEVVKLNTNLPLDFSKGCKVYVEYSTDFGRMDIVIVVGSEVCIVIENKIYAGEQPSQLERYNKWLDSQKFKSKELIYLTLKGSESVFQGRYIRASYLYDISRWLENCISLAKGKPHVEEILRQYKKHIDWLSRKDDVIMNEMTQKICHTICMNSDSFSTAREIAEAYNQLDIYAAYKLATLLHNELSEDVRGAIKDIRPYKERSWRMTKITFQATDRTYILYIGADWKYIFLEQSNPDVNNPRVNDLKGIMCKYFNQNDISKAWGKQNVYVTSSFDGKGSSVGSHFVINNDTLFSVCQTYKSPESATAIVGFLEGLLKELFQACNK